MKQRNFILLLLLSLVLLTGSSTAWAVETEDVESFLTSNYPVVDGTIIYKEDGEYYAEVSTNLSEARVEIYRQEVVSTKNTQRLAVKTVGLVDLELSESDSLKLNLPDALKQNLNLGDRLRLPDRPLVIRNHSRMDTETLRKTAKSNPRVETVLTGEGVAPDRYYQLTVTADRLSLSGIHGDGTVREIASQTLQTELASGRNQTPPDLLKNLTTLDRRINDLERVKTTPDDAELVVLGARNEIGFARYDGSLTDISWDSVQGNVLDLSLRARDGEERPLDLLVVLKRNGTVRTRYYTLNTSNRSLDRVWTVSHRWIRESSGSFYQQQIGLNTPFEYGVRNVELTKDGPRTLDTPENLTQRYLYSPAYLIRGKRLYSLTKDQKLEIFEDAKQVLRTSRNYGGGPTVVSARNSGSKVNLNPEFSHWINKENGSERLLLPHNIASGITAFRGLTSYNASRLHLLELKEGIINRLWKSDRLPGYVSSTASGPGREALVTVVNGESEVTRVFRVDTGQLK